MIIKEWQNQLNNGITIRLEIKNVATFRNKSDIVGTLGAAAGVAAARERSWNADSKLLEVDVQYKGTVDGFCSKIDGFKLRSGAGSLAVTGVAGMSVSMKMEAL